MSVSRFIDKVNVYLCVRTLLYMEHCCGQNKCKVGSPVDHDPKIWKTGHMGKRCSVDTGSTVIPPSWGPQLYRDKGDGKDSEQTRETLVAATLILNPGELIPTTCRTGKRKREADKLAKVRRDNQRRRRKEKDRRKRLRDPRSSTVGGKQTIPPGSGVLAP